MSPSRALIFVAACATLGRSHPAPVQTSPTPQRDLYLLAGQSNMAGRGTVEAADRVPVNGIMMLDRRHAAPAVGGEQR
jgi:hypothetical protein